MAAERVLIDFHSARYPLWTFPRPAYDALVEQFPTVMFHYCTSHEDFRTHLPAATVVFGPLLREEDLPLASQLRWYHTAWHGVAKHLTPAFLATGITLTSSAGVRAGALAEYILGMVIAFNRQLPRLIEAQRRAEWIAPALWEDYEALPVLDGGRLVIAGLGGIGQEVARLAKAFGMEIWGTRRDPTLPIAWVDRLEGPEALLDLLPGAAVVVDTLPATPATEGLFDAAHFAAMGPAALFVNIGRGASVDETALIGALQTRQIRGAILDVFRTEPLPAESPLWGLPNCLITPHTSNITANYWPPTIEFFTANLRRYLLGQPLINVVNPERGY